MLVSGVFASAAVGLLLLAAYSKIADVRAFGQISNLLTAATALLLLALYVLVWEVTVRVIARSDD
jgi:hypothetical protein